MEKLTIMTPTYNRAYILENAYDSLVRQKNKDFIWLIVDDGSSDNTESLVKKWIKDKKIKIEYYKKENGGKHTAINYALDRLKTEYVVLSLDSDDYFTDDAVEVILNKLDEKKCGLVFLCDDEKRSGRYKIKYDIISLSNCSISKAFSQNLFNASAIFVFKSNYIKNYKFPIFKNESFFNEGYMLYQLDEPIVWIDNALCIREYKEDGLTKNIFKTYYNNPNSWYLYNKLRYEKSKNIKRKIKYKIYEITFGLLSKSNFIKNASNKALTLLLLPLGFIGYIHIKIRVEKK